jgi:hypothetical protein
MAGSRGLRPRDVLWDNEADGATQSAARASKERDKGEEPGLAEEIAREVRRYLDSFTAVLEQRVQQLEARAVRVQ